jgi:hypothetical protein
MIHTDQTGIQHINPEALLVNPGEPLFRQLNNVEGPGPGGIAALRLDKTVKKGLRRIDVNPIGIVRDFAAAGEQFFTADIPMRTLTAETRRSQNRHLAEIQDRFRALEESIGGVVADALMPFLDPERHRVVSRLELRYHNADHYQPQAHPDPSMLNFYFGEARTIDTPAHFVQFKPNCKDDRSIYDTDEAIMTPMPDNTVVMYRSNYWAGFATVDRDDGFSSHGYAIQHGSHPEGHEGFRTVGLGSVVIRGVRTGRQIYSFSDD